MSGPDLVLRESILSDAESIAACVATVAREGKYLASMSGFTADETRLFLDKLAKYGGFQIVAVEAISDRVVGWCDVTRMPFHGMAHVGRLGMGVLLEFRGQGIGRRLLQAALAAANERGIWRVELEVFASNTRARRLYEAEGFALEGTKKKARIVDGEEDDIVVMAHLSGGRRDG